MSLHTLNIAGEERSPVVVHYGASWFDAEKFRNVRNEGGFNKPKGGLWASPLDSEHSWERWCRSEEFRVELLEECVPLIVKKSAKILVIDSVNDVVNLPQQPLDDIEKICGRSFARLDFEKLAKKYDVIWLTARGERDTRWTDVGKYSLYGWDVEAVLFLNMNGFTIKPRENGKQ